MKDDVPNATEKVMYWTDYVIKHEGAKHLRQEGINMPLYQYLLLDIIMVSVLVVVLIIALTLLVLIKIRKLFPTSLKKLKNN